MMAAASIRKLKADPAIRTVDVGSSISGTRHSVPITLTYRGPRGVFRIAYCNKSSRQLFARRHQCSVFIEANLPAAPSKHPLDRVLIFLDLARSRNGTRAFHAQRT